MNSAKFFQENVQLIPNPRSDALNYNLNAGLYQLSREVSELHQLLQQQRQQIAHLEAEVRRLQSR